MPTVPTPPTLPKLPAQSTAAVTTPSLPQGFLEDMKGILNEEFPKFLATYQEPKTSGLRVNTLKIGAKEFDELGLFRLREVSWCKEGFSYDETYDRPGRHPFHEAGLYYLQEPSAMGSVPLLEISPGERVLDLCAAPGGKATHIGQLLKGKGLLVANEISPSRVKALGENIERLGITNAIITNSPGQTLVRRFPAFFQKILLDAPCSGQGMFRKDPMAIADWSREKEEECARIQEELLDSAYMMLDSGGTLVYSTCTFSRRENEERIAAFLEKHPKMQLLHMERLWPHRSVCEGHFLAKLRKAGEPSAKIEAKTMNSSQSELAKIIKDFVGLEEFVEKLRPGLFVSGPRIMFFSGDLPKTDGLRVLRTGVHIGTMKKGRFEPDHAFSHIIPKDCVSRSIEFAPDSDEIFQYLGGLTPKTGGNNGWILVTTSGFPVGWGKEVQGVLKNHFPRGLRKNLR